MSLFKETMSHETIFPTVKSAALEVSIEDKAKWRQEVDEYVNSKYPGLAQGFRSVNFKLIKDF